MMKIPYLLNPFCGDHFEHRRSRSPTPSPHPVVSLSGLRRQKVAKDAPIFSEGNKPVGIVNFLPHEAGNDQDLLDQQRKFQIYPLGEIYKKGVRHIPYNSDKKDFLDKTGRDAFEMFQYTYKKPGEEKEYVVAWDYNVGLVRMTPFFKSCKYSKTIPAKALRENPGLKDISYSITGGALVCQGYWMPFHAARAVAATFCYDIRWALTPVFGNDFPSMCLPPTNPCFAKFFIDPAIVQYCTMETDRFRREGPTYAISRSTVSSPQEVNKTQSGSPPTDGRVMRQRRARPADIESGYGTDTDRSDRYFCSPEVSPRTQFRPVNRSLSPVSPRTTVFPTIAGSPVRTHGPHGLLIPGTSQGEENGEGSQTKRTHSKVALDEHGDDEALSRPQTAATIDSAQGSETSGGVANPTHADIDAAAMLLSLCAADNVMPPLKRTRRGSNC